MQPETKIDQAPSTSQAKTEDVKQDLQSTQATDASSETPEQINWKKFREEREKERKQLDQERKDKESANKEAQALKAAMDAILNKPHPSQQQSVPDNNYEDESEEQRIDKKVNAALEKRYQQEQIERQKREAAELPINLQKAYGDFNQTCTTENLDYLEYHYPEVATPYKHMPDGFEKWSSIYKAVKKFVPNTDSRKESNRAEKNFTKPQSASTPGVSQSGNATSSYVLSEQRKAENWARMERSRKGLS